MTRNRMILAASLMCAVLLAVSAQAEMPLNAGITLGASIATMSGDATKDIDTKTRAGFTVGGFLEVNVSEFFAIQPEARYVQKGVQKEGGNEEKVKMDYLETAVLVKVKFPVDGKIKPSLFVGPAAAINLSGKGEETIGDDSYDYDISNVKSLDICSVFGAAVAFPLGDKLMAVADVRYNMGFGTAFDDVDPPVVNEEGEWAFVEDEETGEAEDLKNRNFSVSLGLVFPL